jgi:hypothetical protein
VPDLRKRPPASPESRFLLGITGRSDQRIDRPLLPASIRCGHVLLRADGVSGQGMTCCGEVSGNRSPCRRRAESLWSSCHRLGGHVRWSVCRWTSTGQLAARWTAVSATRAASPVSVRTHAALQPAATAALRRRCPAAGRVTGARTPQRGQVRLADVQCGRCPSGVDTSPLDRTAADHDGHPDRFRRCRPGDGPGFRTPADSLPYPATARRPGETARGSGHRGGGRCSVPVSGSRRRSPPERPMRPRCGLAPSRCG